MGRLAFAPVPRREREKRLGLRCAIGLPSGEQGVARLLERRLSAFHVIRLVERACSAEDQLGTLLVFGPEL